MGTRQIRISDQQLINKRLADSLNKKLTVVLADGNVFPGTVCAVTPGTIILQNARLKKVTYARDTIVELYVDELV